MIKRDLTSAVSKAAFGSETRSEAPASPEPSNEGGITVGGTSSVSKASEAPPLVTRGESIHQEFIAEDGEKYFIVLKNGHARLIHLPQPKIDGVPSAATVDYLNCSFHFSAKEGLNDFLSTFIPIVGDGFASVVDRDAKFHCYHYSFDLGDSKAIFAYGGNNETALLSLSGFSCHMVPNWKRLVNYLANIRKAKITRVDLAHDDYEGIYSVDIALEMYKQGLFNTGGRPPLMDQRGNWLCPDGRGRTLYIGSSKNGKLLRVYDKGMEQGAPFHPWTRWELQYGSRDRVIPWEAVLEPGKYLAGGYPKATGWILTEQSRIATIQKSGTIGYEKLIHHASTSYGPLVNVMMDREDGDASKVISMLIRAGTPSRLRLPAVAEGQK